MNALDMLKMQHREAMELFDKIEDADGPRKQMLFERLADALAIHATIEEQYLYPQSLASQTEAMLREAVEEHLSAKRVIADLLEVDASHPSFDAKIKVLREQIEHHAGEEEDELFPMVKKVLSKTELETMGDRMEALAKSLEGTQPRLQVPHETSHVASLGRKSAGASVPRHDR